MIKILMSHRNISWNKDMNTVLITGGFGFLGKSIINTLFGHHKGLTIKIIVRNSNHRDPVPIPSKNDCLIENVVGDITDIDFIKESLVGIDSLIHLAAIKDISLCESDPIQAVKTNIIGTSNLLDNFKGNTFLAISSNKAVYPESCYGATKLLMEKLILSKARKDPLRRYLIVRSGNIIGSKGSVVDLWKNQIHNNNEITVTNPDMTRYVTDVNSLSEYIVHILKKGKTGTINIPEHRQIKLETLAKATIELFGNNTTKMNIIGMKPGETVHDLLCTSSEPIIYESEQKSPKQSNFMELDEVKSLLQRL